MAQLFIGLFCLSWALGVYAQPSNYVRVLIIEDAQSLAVKASGSYEISDAINKKILYRGRNLNTAITAHKTSILIAGESFSSRKVFIKTNNPDTVSINGRTFRGDIQLTNNNAKLSAINFIELEDYIKGISVREISHYWPPEALKAEVIVFRTFALYKMQENREKDYDLTSDIYSQVYSGQAAERYRINQAVDQTRAVVLNYQGKIFPAFYHATCAGHTEDASLIWNIKLAPLKGVVCNFCKDSPHFSWHYVLSADELSKRLAAGGFKLGRLRQIIILDRDSSGRITDLNIMSSAGDYRISAKDFRELIGPNIIRSTNFSVQVINNDIIFEGYGWGHGVGLCQWGAYFMAKEGYKAVEILKYYYPDSDVRTIRF